MRLMECNMRAICLEIYNSWMLTLVEYFKTIKTSSKAHVFYKKQEKFPTGKHNSINQLNHSSYCSPNSFSLPHHKRYFIVIIPKLHTLSIERGNHRKKKLQLPSSIKSRHDIQLLSIFFYFCWFFRSFLTKNYYILPRWNCFWLSTNKLARIGVKKRGEKNICP